MLLAVTSSTCDADDGATAAQAELEATLDAAVSRWESLLKRDLLGVDALEAALARENDERLPLSKPKTPRKVAVAALTNAIARRQKRDARLWVRVRVFPDVNAPTELEVKRSKKALRVAAAPSRTTAQWQSLSKAIRTVVGAWPICSAWADFNTANTEEGFGLVGPQNRVPPAPRPTHDSPYLRL